MGVGKLNNIDIMGERSSKEFTGEYIIKCEGRLHLE